MRTPVLGQILLHESREGIVQLPPRLRRNRIQHQRTLPRARNAREDSDLIFGNVQGDVLQVVLPSAPDAYDVPLLHILCEDTKFCGISLGVPHGPPHARHLLQQGLQPHADKEISRIPQAASDNRSAGALETKGRRVQAPAWFFRVVTSSKQAWLPPLHKKNHQTFVWRPFVSWR